MSRGTEARGGAGIPGGLETVTGFSLLHISFPPASPDLSPSCTCHLPDELQKMVLCCFHQTLVWREPEEKFCKRLPIVLQATSRQ